MSGSFWTVLIGRDGVKFTIRLSDGRVLVRHADRVRVCCSPSADRGHGGAPDPADLASPPADAVPAEPAAGGAPGSPAGPVSPVQCWAIGSPRPGRRWSRRRRLVGRYASDHSPSRTDGAMIDVGGSVCTSVKKVSGSKCYVMCLILCIMLCIVLS